MKRPRRLFRGALVELPRDSTQDDGFLHPQSSSGLEWVAVLDSGCPQRGMILCLSCEGPQGPQNQPFLKPPFAIPSGKGFGRGGHESKPTSRRAMSAFVGLTVTAGDESHHQRMFGTKLACLLSHLLCPSFLQLWSRDILGTNLSHSISHIPVPRFTF